ncbi:MAG: zinc-ribbon domain-containing protein, partial [Candidatus Heimdallarchaeaceae archaeon]
SLSYASSTIIDDTDYLSSGYFVVFQYQKIKRDATIHVSLSVSAELAFFVCDGGEMLTWNEGGPEPNWYYVTSVNSYSSFSFDLEGGKYDFVLINLGDSTSTYHLVVTADYKGLSTGVILLIVIAAIFVIGGIAGYLQGRKKQKLATQIPVGTTVPGYTPGYIQQPTSMNSVPYVTEQTTPKKFCSNCGAQIDVNAAFCPQCGAKQN